MRIALISAHFEPDQGGNAVIATLLSEEFARLGHEVWVGTTRPWYRSVSSLPPLRNERLIVDRAGRGRGRILTYLRLHLAMLAWWRALRRADVIVSMSPPITLGLLSAFLGWGRATVYNIQDVFPEVLLRTGRIRRGVILYLCRVAEHLTYRHSAALVTVGDSQLRFLVASGQPPGKLSTIPNFADVRSLRPHPRDLPFRSALGVSPERVVVYYGGNFGILADLDVIASCIARSERTNITFLFTGGGRDYARIAALNDKYDNLLMAGFLDRSELPRAYAASDICLVTLKKGLSCCSVPSKTYSIMASGRPFVAAIDGDSDVARLAAASGGGLCVPPGDSDALAAALDRLARDPELRAKMGRDGHQFVMANHTPEVAARAYLALFDRVFHQFN